MKTNKNLEKVLFNFPCTFERTAITFFVSSLGLIFIVDLKNDPFLLILIYYGIVLYLSAIFFLKKFIFYEDNYLVKYPLRPFSRRKVISYNLVERIIYNANEIKVVLNERFLKTVIKTGIQNKSEIIKLLKEIKKRGVKVEVIFPEDQKLVD